MMGELLAPHLRAWERDYRSRGKVWRGTTGFAPPELKGRVLELGCGNGKTASALSLSKGVELHAIDCSPTAVRLCAELVKRVGGNACVREANGLELPFEDGFFDAVVCFHYAGHLPANERVKAVGEAKRVLKRGGKLFFKEFGASDFRFGKGTQVENATFKRGNGVLTHYFSEEEVHGLFADFHEDSLGHEKWRVFLRGTAFQREEINAV
ncbi:TPA: class I SAM-dependent methyltransferase, partial [Candidatus Micrarchaeota archaeon]|nr:class I SAM-dependent methyltransferase [Candidatus Micrarchaeota archaeon]